VDDYVTNIARVLGTTLDVSLMHTNGRRTLDVVKKELVDFVREVMDGEDLFYLYHPDLVDPVYDVGKMVSAIGNYETDGWVFDLRYALKLTYYVIAGEDEDAEKMLLFITDRAQDEVAIDKILTLKKREDSDCRFVFVGIGRHYCKDLLNRSEVTYIHLDDPADLNQILLEKLGHEEEL
jgi:hypothetical protein